MSKAGNRISGRIFWIGLVLFLAGLAGWILLLIHGDAARAWRVLLINFLYFTPLATGLVTWSAVVTVSNGTWPGEAERLSWTGFGFLLPSLAILGGLWVGSPQWAPWYGVKLPQGFWLDNTYLFVRDLGALVIWWGFATWYLLRRRAGRKQAVVPGAILIAWYGIAFSLIGFDLGMALTPGWQSSLYGGYFFMSGMYNAVVLWAFMTVLHPQYGKEMRSDFGNLIIALSLITTYLFYAQLLSIWYENLPKETGGVITRMNYPGWNSVSLALISLLYLSPLVLLLSASAKRNRLWLGWVAFLLLVGIWFQRWWLVMPEFMPQVTFGWTEISGTAAVLGLMLLGMNLSKKWLPPVHAGEEP